MDEHGKLKADVSQMSIAPASRTGDAHKPLKMTSISSTELWSDLCHMSQPISVPQVTCTLLLPRTVTCLLMRDVALPMAKLLL